MMLSAEDWKHIESILKIVLDYSLIFTIIFLIYKSKK